MKKRNIVLYAISVVLFFATLFIGCDKEGTVELSTVGNVYEITRNGTLQFEVSAKGISGDATYEVVSGDGVINNDGILKANVDAEIGSEIVVVAKVGEVLSNQISVGVVHLMPSEISLIPSNDKIAIGGKVEFTIEATPNYSSYSNYSLKILSGDDIAEIVDGVLKIKDGVTGEEAEGKEIEVKAILSDSNISATTKIEVVSAEKVTSVIAKNKNIIAGKNAIEKIEPSAYNEAGYLLETASGDYSYSSSDETICTVGANTGVVSPKGHGECEITITYLNGVSSKCKVFVMVPPENISIDNINSYINDKRSIDFGLSGTLNLNVKATNKVGYLSSSDMYNYKFELVDDDYNVLESGDSVAVIEKGKVKFKKTGVVKVTITTNSSLNNVKTDMYEKSTFVYINVNNGLNVYSVAQLKEYAKDENAGKVCNILSDIYLDKDNNFGIVGGSKYSPLYLKGDRKINGNGYMISSQRLPLLASNTTGNDMLYFIQLTNNTPFSVEVNNLEVVGCGGVNGLYNGEVSEDMGKKIISENGNYVNTYRRAIRLQGNEYKNIDTMGKSYIKSAILNNVKVSGFNTGLRIEHVVDGYLNDIVVNNCFANGIESNQNIMTINNLTVGQVGAFAIEMTPDDIANLSTNPSGTAGKNYNETSTLTMTGSIDSNNYNNGGSTPYMTGITARLGYSIPTIIEGVASNLIGEIGGNDSELKTKMSTVVNEISKNEEGKMNFYLLIFIAPGTTSYTKGNTENIFGKYSSDTSVGNNINMREVLENVAKDVNYTGYKDYKYTTIDLDTGALGYGNIGQIVIVNESYENK
ncbi:MAG: hypothetical protein E7345_03650 [Clostridiales bacterium]|nr:hypothetical protein [Clostridiales bacterium]